MRLSSWFRFIQIIASSRFSFQGLSDHGLCFGFGDAFARFGAFHRFVTHHLRHPRRRQGVEGVGVDGGQIRPWDAFLSERVCNTHVSLGGHVRPPELLFQPGQPFAVPDFGLGRDQFPADFDDAVASEVGCRRRLGATVPPFAVRNAQRTCPAPPESCRCLTLFLSICRFCPS
nr:hypothetical protein [uncultured Rhodopila sp.]